MELLTQNLPSGIQYPFASIHIMPMKFAEILEYLENVPDRKKNPIENYYFNYCLVKDEDPNVDNLLLCDMEYVVFMKKALTIAENLQFNSECNCPRCGAKLSYNISLAGVEWNHLSDDVKGGLLISFGGSMQKVRMPKVSEFMEVFKKYRRYKKVTDMRIIKLIALFEQSMMYLQKVENEVTSATYKDISALFMLESLFYNFIKPKTLFCSDCAKMYVPTDLEIWESKEIHGIKQDDDLPQDLYEEIQAKHGGVDIGLETIVSDFFRDLCQNNRLTIEEVLPGEVREVEQSGDPDPDIY